MPKAYRWQHAAALISLLSLFALLLLRSAPLQKAATEALRFSAMTLIPALFPFSVLARLFAEGGLLPVGNPLSRRCAKALGISEAGLAPFLLGLFCGYPMGGYTAACLWEKGVLTKEEAYRIGAVACSPGMAFLLLTVSSLYKDRRVGITLFLSVNLASLLYALLTAKNKVAKTPLPPLPPFPPPKGQSPMQRGILLLSDAIVKGGTAMLSLAAFVTFFATLSEAFHLLCPLPLPSALFSSLLESTASVRSSLSLFSSHGGFSAVSLMAAGIGWSGLSVLLQTEALFRGSLPFAALVKARGCIALLSSLLAAVLWWLMS